MNLTPLDIRRQQFTKAFRGYEPAEVDAFLEQVSEQQEGLLDQVRHAQERTREMEAKLAHYERVELALQEALESSKESARRAEAAAKEKAKIIVEQAELEAKSMLHDAERERYGLRQDLVQLSARQTEVAARLRGFLLSELEVLAQFQGEDSVGYRRLAGGAAGALPPGPPAEPAREPASPPVSEPEPAPAPPPVSAPAEDVVAAQDLAGEPAGETAPPADDDRPGGVDAEGPDTAQPPVADHLPVDEIEADLAESGVEPDAELEDADDALALEEPAPDAAPLAGDDEPVDNDKSDEWHAPAEEWHAPADADDAPLPVDPEPPAMSVDEIEGGFAETDAPPSSDEGGEADDQVEDATAEDVPGPATPPLTLGGWDLRSLVTGQERSEATSEADRERIRRILDDLD